MSKSRKFIKYIKNHELLNFSLLLAAVLVLALIIMPHSGQKDDMAFWISWIESIKSVELKLIYTVEGINYFPIYIYVLAFFGSLFNSASVLAANIYQIKYIIILFDFATVFTLGAFLKQKKLSTFLALMLLFNPAFLYNSFYWGQIEALYIFFGVASVFAALNKHKYLSIVLFVFAFYSKLQAVVFLPVLVLLLLPQFKLNFRDCLKALAVTITSNLVIIFPFLDQLKLMYAQVLKSVNLFPYVTFGAFNFWWLIFGRDLARTHDSEKFLNIPYLIWGLTLFVIFSLIAVIPLASEMLSGKKRIHESKFISLVMLTNAVLAFCFFFFNTQMHERYLQPVITFTGIALIFSFSKRLLALYAFISICFLLNLEKVSHLVSLPESVLPDSRIVSLAVALCLVWFLLELYKDRNIKLDLTHFRKILPRFR